MECHKYKFLPQRKQQYRSTQRISRTPESQELGARRVAFDNVNIYRSKVQARDDGSSTNPIYEKTSTSYPVKYIGPIPLT